MEKMKYLKFTKENLFNSETLQQYDEEGQKIFLSYMLYKGYDFEIKKNEIIFTGIVSEKQVESVIKRYNKESQISDLKNKKYIADEIENVGVNEYKRNIDKKLKGFEINREAR